MSVQSEALGLESCPTKPSSLPMAYIPFVSKGRLDGWMFFIMAFSSWTFWKNESGKSGSDRIHPGVAKTLFALESKLFVRQLRKTQDNPFYLRSTDPTKTLHFYQNLDRVDSYPCLLLTQPPHI